MIVDAPNATLQQVTHAQISADLFGVVLGIEGKQAKAGFCCFVSSLLEYEGPGDLSSLWADKAFVFRAPVNVSVKRSKVMRTRPRFNNWHVTVSVVFIPSLLNRSEVLEFFEIAGFREGLGDWRPKFGKFSVKEIN